MFKMLRAITTYKLGAGITNISNDVPREQERMEAVNENIALWRCL